MPKIIKKYKLESEFSNESEFEVTRVKIVETRKTMRTDDEGYPISDRQSPTTETVTKHGIIAVSLPSRKPAKVIPLEVADVSEAKALMIEGSENTVVHQDRPPIEPTDPGRPKPIRTKHLLDNTQGPDGRPAAVNLTKAMQGPNQSPVPVPKAGEITWADGSDSRSDNAPHPF